MKATSPVAKLLYHTPLSDNIEHTWYTFELTKFPRAVLQELSRHRDASPSVRSSRYTLKELKDEVQFNSIMDDGERARKYIYFTGEKMTDRESLNSLESLRWLIYLRTNNDIAKFAMPECYLTEEVLTIDAQSLSNFFALRCAGSALWAIRDLARSMYEELPIQHKELYKW